MEIFVTLDSDWESGITINLASPLWEASCHIAVTDVGAELQGQIKPVKSQ